MASAPVAFPKKEDIVSIRKAVITAAGWGSRFMPATKAIPKEMLPVLNKPLIQYAVEEAAASGIEDVVIITADATSPIKKHFGWAADAFSMPQGNQPVSLRDLNALCGSVRFSYVQQRGRRGLGHAVLSAEEAVAGVPFVLLLPDEIILGARTATSQLLDVFDEHHACVVGLQQVKRDQVSDYGIIQGVLANTGLWRIERLIEKPTVDEAPSTMSVIGRYILTPDIFDALRNTPPGKNAEIQLTDSLNSMASNSVVLGCDVEGKRFDAGTPLGILKAAVAMGLETAEWRTDLYDYLSSIIQRSNRQ